MKIKLDENLSFRLMVRLAAKSVHRELEEGEVSQK